MIRRVTGLFFSPTGTTEKVVRAVTEGAAEVVRHAPASTGTDSAEDRAAVAELVPTYIDLTMPDARRRDYEFGPGDLVIVGCPTYAGRLPNKIMPDLREHLHSRDFDTCCIPVVTFGNRGYDQSLKELALILKENGFTVAAGAAAVCRHAFSRELAAGRPDKADLAALARFGGQAAQQILAAVRAMDAASRHTCGAGLASEIAAEAAALDILAGRDLTVGPYYIPKKEDGTPAKFLKAKSKADPGKCSRCMLCAAACPMGSIDQQDPFHVPGICIKCQACVRKCPGAARYFDDPDFLSHVRMLEKSFGDRRENVFVTGNDRRQNAIQQ